MPASKHALGIGNRLQHLARLSQLHVNFQPIEAGTRRLPLPFHTRPLALDQPERLEGRHIGQDVLEITAGEAAS